MEIKKTIQTYDGLKGTCGRVQPNPNSPWVSDSKLWEGIAWIMPQVGCRFRCGSLDTNVVAKILEETEDTVKFETLSGSIYLFTILERGKELSEILLPDNTEVIKALENYLRED